MRKPSSDHTVIISEAAKSPFESWGLLEHHKPPAASKCRLFLLSLCDAGDRQGQSPSCFAVYPNALWCEFKRTKKEGKTFSSLLREPLLSYQPRGRVSIAVQGWIWDLLIISAREQFLRPMKSNPIPWRGEWETELVKSHPAGSQEHGSSRRIDFLFSKQEGLEAQLGSWEYSSHPQTSLRPKIFSLRSYIVGWRWESSIPKLKT